MGVNYKAMKAADAELKQGEGGTLLKQKELKEDSIFRISPNSEQMNGLLYMKVKQYWFGKTSVICSSTIGKADVIQAEIDDAMNGDDAAEIQAILADEKQFNMQEVLWYPGWLLEYKMNEENEIVGLKVIGDKPRVLSCGPQLAGQINEICYAPLMERIKSKDGITDRKLGYNLNLSRKKTGSEAFDVKYTAKQEEQMAIPMHIWMTHIDLYAYVKSMIPNPSWQQAKIRELIHGEPISKEIQAKEDARKAKYKEAFREQQEALKKQIQEQAKAKKTEPAEEGEAEETAAEEVVKPKPAASTKPKVTKPIVADDDEGEEGAPFEGEDGEDADPEPEEVTKPAATAKTKPKPAVKPTMEKDIDSDDF